MPGGGLAIGSGCGIFFLLEEGFGFEVLEVLEGFEILVDLLVDYGHFLIKNQLKSK